MTEVLTTPHASSESRRLRQILEPWIGTVHMAEEALAADAGDQPRLRYYRNRIELMHSQLEDMQHAIRGQEPLVEHLRRIACQLREAEASSTDSSVQAIWPIARIRRTQGRPRNELDELYIHHALHEQHYSLRKIQQDLQDSGFNISSRTIRRRILDMGFRRDGEPTADFTDISDEQLATLIEHIWRHEVEAGASILQGHLHSFDVRRSCPRLPYQSTFAPAPADRDCLARPKPPQRAKKVHCGWAKCSMASRWPA